MWKWVLNDTNGALNSILMGLGILRQPIAWLAMPDLTMIVLTQVHAWTTIPLIMVILLAGLQTIPHELYEVADIDGAGSVQKFRVITIPMLMPAIQSSVMLSTIFAFRTFDIVFTLTRGGPGESTEMLVTYIYNTAFVFGRLGYASALSVIMVFLSMAIVALFVKILPAKDL
jgi:multiple sugar transport system permease protein